MRESHARSSPSLSAGDAPSSNVGNGSKRMMNGHTMENARRMITDDHLDGIRTMTARSNDHIPVLIDLSTCSSTEDEDDCHNFHSQRRRPRRQQQGLTQPILATMSNQPSPSSLSTHGRRQQRLHEHNGQGATTLSLSWSGPNGHATASSASSVATARRMQTRQTPIIEISSSPSLSPAARTLKKKKMSSSEVQQSKERARRWAEENLSSVKPKKTASKTRTSRRKRGGTTATTTPKKMSASEMKESRARARQWAEQRTNYRSSEEDSEEDEDFDPNDDGKSVSSSSLSAPSLSDFDMLSDSIPSFTSSFDNVLHPHPSIQHSQLSVAGLQGDGSLPSSPSDLFRTATSRLRQTVSNTRTNEDEWNHRSELSSLSTPSNNMFRGTLSRPQNANLPLYSFGDTATSGVFYLDAEHWEVRSLQNNNTRRHNDARSAVRQQFGASQVSQSSAPINGTSGSGSHSISSPHDEMSAAFDDNSLPTIGESRPNEDAQTWTCPRCTLHNQRYHVQCDACYHVNPSLALGRDTYGQMEPRHSSQRPRDVGWGRDRSLPLPVTRRTGVNSFAATFGNNYRVSHEIHAFSQSLPHQEWIEYWNGGDNLNRGATSTTISSLPSMKIRDPERQLPEDKRQCCICLEDFAKGHNRTALPCLHGFHSDCVNRWLRSNGSCPVCKNPIST